jgi:hypothetical protein
MNREFREGTEKAEWKIEPRTRIQGFNYVARESGNIGVR